MSKYIPCITLILVLSLSSALMGRSEVKVIRPVVPEGNEQYQAIYLDEEVYRYAKEDLRDLRIV